MRVILFAVLSGLAARGSADAAILSLNFDGLRVVAPPPMSDVSRVKYKIEKGPAGDEPQALVNLTQKQLEAAVEFMIPDLKSPPKNLSPLLVYRMMDVLMKVDIYYKRPIPPAEWDRRLGEMKAGFVARHGPPGRAKMSAEQWETSVDEMLSGFVRKLDDHHSLYMDRRAASRYDAEMRSDSVGTGLRVEKTAAEEVVITAVVPGSPAEKAGLVVGDVILAINGAPMHWSARTVLDRLDGPAGTRVKVRVARLPEPVIVVRGKFVKPDCFGKMVAPGIGYVHFPQFSDNIDKHVFKIIDDLMAVGGARKLIIDLRGNRGGLLSMAQSIGSEFLKNDDVIVLTERQGRLAEKALTDGPGRYFGMPLAVIVNGWSASSSEVVAAALQEHGAAVIVGPSPSYGKGSFQLSSQTEVPVFDPKLQVAVDSRPDGTRLNITDGGWKTPGDRSIEGVHNPETGLNIPASGGVKPDAAVTMSAAEEEAAMESVTDQLFGAKASDVKDAAIDTAVEVLSRR